MLWPAPSSGSMPTGGETELERPCMGKRLCAIPAQRRHHAQVIEEPLCLLGHARRALFLPIFLSLPLVVVAGKLQEACIVGKHAARLLALIVRLGVNRCPQ